jgi:cytochrome c oxidase assembly factor CtaG
MHHALGWTFDPLVVTWLVTFAAIYAGGVIRLRASAGDGKGISALQIAAFAAGWLTLIVALVSPLDALSDSLFSAHMIQHELLMIVAAPLIAVSAPFVAASWLFRPRFRGTQRHLRILLTEPAVVWLLHAAVLWVWHVPLLFQAAMAHPSIHVVQHFCFFSSACLFWWGIAHGRYGRLGYGAAVIYLFTTAVHSGVLGALLTLSPSIWYPVYSATTSAWGYTPLEDQQLAGLVMWVPASVVFLAGGLGFLAAWIRESARRSRVVAD